MTKQGTTEAAPTVVYYQIIHRLPIRQRENARSSAFLTSALSRRYRSQHTQAFRNINYYSSKRRWSWLGFQTTSAPLHEPDRSHEGCASIYQGAMASVVTSARTIQILPSHRANRASQRAAEVIQTMLRSMLQRCEPNLPHKDAATNDICL